MPKTAQCPMQLKTRSQMQPGTVGSNGEMAIGGGNDPTTSNYYVTVARVGDDNNAI